MTFDEAYAYADEYTHTVGDYDEPDIRPIEVEEIINGLKETYRPKIEMTQTQYNFLMGNDGLVDIIGNVSVDGIVKEYFDEDFWNPLNERDVARAWLHPECVKVVD